MLQVRKLHWQIWEGCCLDEAWGQDHHEGCTEASSCTELYELVMKTVGSVLFIFNTLFCFCFCFSEEGQCQPVVGETENITLISFSYMLCL